MPIFQPERLAEWTGGRWTAVPAVPLAGFHFDSRLLRPGEMFVALRTEQRDGHAFLAAAQAAGAGAALVSRPEAKLTMPQLVVADPLAAWHTIAREHRRLFRGPVVGISGSAGKTSTKDLLALLLGGAESGVAATEGNLNNHLGVPLTLTRLDPARHRFAVIEAGIGAPGEMAPLAGMIQPDVSLITLVAHAHTRQLGGIEGVAREKALLPAATRPEGVAIFTKQTAMEAAFRELDVRRLVVERAEVVRPVEPPRDRVYFTVTHREDETAVVLAYGRPPPLVFSLRRVSDGMAENAVLAICTALWLGVSGEAIQARLRQWRPAALRGEVRRSEGRLLYLDCYNANPASMADALAAFHAISGEAGPRLYVLGCMEELGREAVEQHRALGRSLRLRAQDRVFAIGTLADEILAGARERGAPCRLEVVASPGEAAEALAAWRGAVFVKGSRRYELERVLSALGEEVAHA